MSKNGLPRPDWKETLPNESVYRYNKNLQQLVADISKKRDDIVWNFIKYQIMTNGKFDAEEWEVNYKLNHKGTIHFIYEVKFSRKKEESD